MQDTLDVTGAGYEYDFTWLHTFETRYSIRVQWKDTTQDLTRFHWIIPQWTIIKLLKSTWIQQSYLYNYQHTFYRTATGLADVQRFYVAGYFSQ